VVWLQSQIRVGMVFLAGAGVSQGLRLGQTPRPLQEKATR